MVRLRVCGVILCNIGLKNEGKSNRFTSNLICPVISKKLSDNVQQ